MLKKDDTGYFMDVQNFSVNDGDGIHTNIFLAGCPLKCLWCANPESHSGINRIAYNQKSCIGCDKCKSVCPNHISFELNTEKARNLCIECKECTKVCPVGSKRTLINKISLSEVAEKVYKHNIFYRYSNGGVTFSGGEPLSQPKVLKKLVDEFYDSGLSLAIETSGYWDWEIANEILSKMDLIFVDLKVFDSELHKKFTGVENNIILENIKNISSLGIDTVVRIPLIEGVNADIDNITQTSKFVREVFRNPKIEILPYHKFGEGKYDSLYIKRPPEYFKRPSDDNINAIENLISSFGVKIVSYK